MHVLRVRTCFSVHISTLMCVCTIAYVSLYRYFTVIMMSILTGLAFSLAACWCACVGYDVLSRLFVNDMRPKPHAWTDRACTLVLYSFLQVIRSKVKIAGSLKLGRASPVISLDPITPSYRLNKGRKCSHLSISAPHHSYSVKACKLQYWFPSTFRGTGVT